MRFPSLAIVGGESLLGKDIREVLRERALDKNVHLIGADAEETGKITEEGDEPVVITAMDETNLAVADAVILAGSASASLKAWDLIGSGTRKGNPNPPAVIDVTRALEEIPSARLRAPQVERGLIDPAGLPAVVAHPAAIALTTFFGQLEPRFRVKRSVVEVFEPASELGKNGIEELHQQSIKLFSFQTLPKSVFDAQLAYAMLPCFGLEAPQSLVQIEMTLERHLASLFHLREAATPMPSLRLIQAPAFHGYSISAWVEFEDDTTAGDLLAAMAADGIEIRSSAEEPVSNVNAAGQYGISVGDIRADRNHPRAFWFWIAADNLRLSAENAVKLVLQLCAD
ncbi:MAG TPA: Asd/ArgC dimerization domain-containing protein [Bryobacteraceae bacterium]|nr:Asd/ArgC dimerization domain-containing protein [Bryobacteraceae bacterium]